MNTEKIRNQYGHFFEATESELYQAQSAINHSNTHVWYIENGTQNGDLFRVRRGEDRQDFKNDTVFAIVKKPSRSSKLLTLINVHYHPRRVENAWGGWSVRELDS